MSTFSPCITPTSERVETGTIGERGYQCTSLAILGYLSASKAVLEPVKEGTQFESRTLISHFKITFKTHGALCGYAVLGAVYIQYSAVHTKPSRQLQILTKKTPVSNLAHSNSHFTLTVLGAVCNRVALLTWNDQRGCVDEVAWTDESMTSFGAIPDSPR